MITRAVRVFAAVVALVCASAVAAHAQRGPTHVIVSPVAEVEVAETQTLIARLVALNQSVVATRIPGIVGGVEVNVGTHVKQGDVLVRLDTELLEIELQRARATFEQAEAGVRAAAATLETAQNVYTRTANLRGSAAYSQGRMDDLTSEKSRSEAELARAEAAIAFARSGLSTAEYNIRNAAIRAPYDGVVVERFASLGEYLNTGAPVVRLIDDDDLEIEADVPTEIVAAVDPGDEVTALFDDGRLATAIVRAVVPSENASTRTRPVRFSIKSVDSDKPLAANQSVTLEAPVGDPRTVLAVSKDALVQQSGGWIIFVVREGKAVPVNVTIGAATGNRFEVRGDLRAGEMVIVRGNERLRPGQPVAFDPPPAAPVAGGDANTVAAGSAGTPSGSAQ